MNRSPYRPAKIQPPLRGRLAATVSPQLRHRYAEPIVRQHLSISKRASNSRYPNEIEKDLELNAPIPITPKPVLEKSTSNNSPAEEPANQELVRLIKPWQWFLIFILFTVLIIKLWQFALFAIISSL